MTFMLNGLQLFFEKFSFSRLTKRLCDDILLP